MKQTAVEFLSEKYMYVTWLRNRDEISASWADKLRAQYLQEAKEMEKEQIINARIDGDENYTLVGNKRKEYAEQYYNETFNTKTK
jgi:hypothetical protein